MATIKEIQPSDEELADQSLPQPGKHQGKTFYNHLSIPGRA